MDRDQNNDLVQRRIKELTNNLHLSIKSMEKLDDAIRHAKQHAQTENNLSAMRKLYTKASTIGGDLLNVYNGVLLELR